MSGFKMSLPWVFMWAHSLLYNCELKSSLGRTRLLSMLHVRLGFHLWWRSEEEVNYYESRWEKTLLSLMSQRECWCCSEGWENWQQSWNTAKATELCWEKESVPEQKGRLVENWTAQCYCPSTTIWHDMSRWNPPKRIRNETKTSSHFTHAQYAKQQKWKKDMWHSALRDVTWSGLATKRLCQPERDKCSFETDMTR